MLQGAADPYDQLPYTDHAYAESHPDRLATVARLQGWEPSGVAGARILELGCGRGGNLLPMAVGLPGATLVGVDRSRRQIEEARRIVGALGLGNVKLEAASFEEVALPSGSFDFVVSHGVYSWVPPASRRALLRTIANSLAPGGVAYVSFNVLPGWYERMAARDWLRFSASRGIEAGASLEWLEWLEGAISPERGAYRNAVTRVRTRLGETDGAYLVHEYLAAEHHPVQVSTFLDEAQQAGLTYLGDAIPASTAFELESPGLLERIQGMSTIDAQQIFDFVRNTSFRRALLVRADTSLARGFCWQPHLDVGAVETLRIASRLRSPEPERFDGPEGSVHVFDPHARAALAELGRVAPRSVHFSELIDRCVPRTEQRAEVRLALASELLSVALATGALDLHAFEPCIETTVVDRPRACPLARWHAAQGGPITNRWHQQVVLPEDLVRLVLVRADGQRPVADLTQDVRDAFSPDASSAVDFGALVRASLEMLAASALLVA